MRCSIESQGGQSTVEAAFIMPVFLLIMGLLLQPAIILYDQCVINNAAAEVCRLVATSTSSESSIRAYANRRLNLIPKADVFHLAGEEWEIEVSGAEMSGEVAVRISGHARPLPLFGVLAGLAGKVDGDGNILLDGECTSSVTPVWVAEGGGSVDEWIGAWD